MSIGRIHVRSLLYLGYEVNVNILHKISFYFVSIATIVVQLLSRISLSIVGVMATYPHQRKVFQDTSALHLEKNEIYQKSGVFLHLPITPVTEREAGFKPLLSVNQSIRFGTATS